MPRAETQWRPFLWISSNIALSLAALHTGEKKYMSISVHNAIADP